MQKIYTLLVSLILLHFISQAQTAFKQGNIVVLRVGNGTTTLANTGNAVFLDEYTPVGVKVQSIALPTTASGGNNPLVLSGTASSEGSLTRSANGKYLAIVGYSTTPPYASSLSATTGTAVPRAIGIIDYTGNVNTSKTLTNYASSNNPRGAYTSDGTKVWMVSGAKGLQYTTVGTSDTATTISNKTSTATAINNLRTVNEFNGQLYVSTGSGTAVRIGAVGGGLPTDTGKLITPVAGLPTANPASPYAFYMAKVPETNPIPNVLYVADDNTNKVGGIKKYSFNTTTSSWDSVGVIELGAIYRGLTGVVNGSTVTLYATRNSDSLVSIIDNAPATAAPSSATYTGIIAAAPTGTVFRGVAMAPFSVLPVNNFTVQLNIRNNIAVLNWEATKEINATCVNYIVEKSNDGKEFNQLAIIAATNNETYSFNDKNYSNTIAYYRIKLVKSDGNKLYSNVVVAKSDNKNGIKLYPNPASDFIVIETKKHLLPVKVELLNIQGLKLFESIIPNTQTTIYIPLTNLAKGTYFVTYKIDSTQYTEKFVK